MNFASFVMVVLASSTLFMRPRVFRKASVAAVAARINPGILTKKGHPVRGCALKRAGRWPSFAFFATTRREWHE